MALGKGKSARNELEALVRAQGEEIDLLRRKIRLLTGGKADAALSMVSMGDYLSMPGKRPSPADNPASISGLNIAYLVVDRDYRVVQLNSNMSELLGCDKNLVSKSKLVDEIDNLSWAPEVLRTLLLDSGNLDHGTPSEFEASRESFDSGPDEHFHFKAIWSETVGTVTVENITVLKNTREYFERLISPNIVNQLLDAGLDPFLPEKRDMSVLFGDLRGFSTFCEYSSVDVVKEVFEDFVLNCMKTIERNGATLDKFVGDEVIALFSAPLSIEGHALHALVAAVELAQACKEIRNSWVDRGLISDELLNANPDILKIGIGLNTGEMMVGLFGSQNTNQYTVLGHHVNIAARLCSSARGGEIIAGMSTLSMAMEHYKGIEDDVVLNIKVKKRPPITVKGIAEPVHTGLILY